MTLCRRIWHAIHEPKSVSIAAWSSYIVFTVAGVAALVHPPNSLQGEVGRQSMTMLAILLVVGGVVGTITALPGWYILERFAVAAVMSSATLYLIIVIGLQLQESSGNRILQISVIWAVITGAASRWNRISQRPFRSELLTGHEA